MMMTGGSGAAFMFEPGEKYLHKLISYINPPEYPKPGEWAFYSTTCRECPAGCGMILWHRDGRVTKAEGNPLHSINRGKLCIRGQSSVQGEYHVDRLSKVLQKQKDGSMAEKNWETAISSIQKDLTSGKKAILISDLQTGSLAGAMDSFAAKFGTQPPHYYEVLNYESLRKANLEMYGQAIIPRYRLKDCDLIVSFGADFLETWLSPVEYARDFSEIHAFKDSSIGKLVYLGPAETMTSLNADRFYIITPGTESGIIHNLIHLLLSKGKITNPAAEIPVYDQNNPYNSIIEKVAEEIMLSRAPLILAGRPEDTSLDGINTVKAANLLNELLGNRDRIDFSQNHALSNTAMKEDTLRLLQSVNSNHILFIHNTNPVYSFRDASKYLKQAGRVVFMGTARNETADLADWILPVHYPLEEWGDYEPWKGTVSLMQPTMRPVFETKAAGNIFLQLSGSDTSFKDLVRENWKNRSQASGITTDEAPENMYGRMLQQGSVFYQSEENHPEYRYNPGKPLSLPVSSSSVLYLFTPASLFFYDGRLSNRPWLQEIPHPVSNIVWQSWLDMNPGKAKDLGIEDGDVVTVSSDYGKVEVPVRLSEGISTNVVRLEIGQGHSNYGKTASGIGVNAFQLLPAANDRWISVKLERTGKKGELLYLNQTKDQEGREIIRELSLEELRGKTKQEDIIWPGPQGYNPERDLYKPHEHKEHRWGMVIDLQACIGCKACEAACYAENNIPVVGRKSCKGGKEMSWLKVPPYLIKNKKTAFIPVPCQHCDAAPCEPVCPVFASVHTQEGLNAQIYNRCIGTRYCSNNCPYKVRRFNWQNISYEYPWTLQLNPEVTVRERGVMEKCTFCVQRIRNAEEKAKLANRPLQDGEIMTACQQTCPTGAIIFGDLKDPESKVRKRTEDQRRYQLLKELNTKPAVMYLKKIITN